MVVVDPADSLAGYRVDEDSVVVDVGRGESLSRGGICLRRYDRNERPIGREEDRLEVRGWTRNGQVIVGIDDRAAGGRGNRIGLDVRVARLKNGLAEDGSRSGECEVDQEGGAGRIVGGGQL